MSARLTRVRMSAVTAHAASAVTVAAVAVAALAVAALAACGSTPGGGGGDPADAATPTTDGDPTADAPSSMPVDAASTPDAPRPPIDAAPPSDASAAALEFDDIFRAFRMSLSMDPVPSDDNIRQGAANHCWYCENNPGDCGIREHNPAGVGYTGENFWERMAYAGFTGMAFTEVMSFFGDPQRAFDAWVSSIYHRLPLVSFQSSAYGYAAGDDCDTGDFAKATTAGPDQRTHWPLAGATAVPVASTPLFPELAPPPLGYPISVHASSPLAVTAHSLVTAAGDVPVDYIFVDAATDPNNIVTELQVYLVPSAPLAPTTTYRATVTGTQNGVAFTESWTFTTAP